MASPQYTSVESSENGCGGFTSRGYLSLGNARNWAHNTEGLHAGFSVVSLSEPGTQTGRMRAGEPISARESLLHVGQGPVPGHTIRAGCGRLTALLLSPPWGRVRALVALVSGYCQECRVTSRTSTCLEKPWNRQDTMGTRCLWARARGSTEPQPEWHAWQRSGWGNRGSQHCPASSITACPWAFQLTAGALVQVTWQPYTMAPETNRGPRCCHSHRFPLPAHILDFPPGCLDQERSCSRWHTRLPHCTPPTWHPMNRRKCSLTRMSLRLCRVCLPQETHEHLLLTEWVRSPRCEQSRGQGGGGQRAGRIKALRSAPGKGAGRVAHP